MKRTEHALRMEIKQLTETGSFEGVLATYNNVDLGGDVIEPGAFTKTIAEHGPEVKLLWQHEPSNVIGTLQLIDGPDALRVKGQIELDDDIPFSKTAYKLLKKRLLSGLSIGYDTVKDETKNGIRYLKELRLWEGSLVTFPMNELAGVTSVKKRGAPGARKDGFDEEYAENVVLAAPWQMMDAISESLFSMLWSGDLTGDELIEAAKLALQQFADAWVAWLPLFMELTADSGNGMGYMRRSAMQLKAKLIASERKEGRRFSGATAASLKECHGNIKSADSILRALFDDEADDDDEDDDTSDDKAARKTTEPIPNHSAAESLIQSIRALIPAANGTGK